MAALGVARVQLLAGPRAPRSKLSTRICAAKETRSFREGDEEAVVTKPTTTENAPLYADEAKVAAARKKDNMSKEMKARLRKEYVGFGGAENSAMSNNYFLWIAIIISVLAVMSKMIGAI
ncbi:low CO2 inducible protein [Monoraphidium neglectum]|uniref:Low CO2 inducible protein n=1 Tax=Monoraphidium neglectum TaxID=145388 RepID=A0A0D2M537_9CHLO|nr:low CO2 inducible protein [Monoraphidium neglectum]KIY96386.1 low CO2 inducible protein [Monoraphidium neglectum]|eukprot:XP_013895406.1 low CO2 inducible protein [Monoraphidium neglectum]